MKNSKNKTTATTIATFLVLTIAATLVALPAANAHTPPWKVQTFAYVNVAPNPVGVGQTVTVYMWLDKVFDGAQLVNNWRFHNYQLTITKPDNTTETLTFDYISDSTSSQYTTYTPAQVGTYTFNFTFPGQAYNTYDHNPSSTYVNDTYLPSSASTTLTVQQQPIPAAITSYPLPSEYWTRPIYGENTDWWSISSNWLGLGSAVNSATGSGTISRYSSQSMVQRYPGDAIGPLTPHIMWTKPLQSGGVVGGNDYTIPGVSYFEGSSYHMRFSNPIIVNGRLYYTEPLSWGTGGSPYIRGSNGPTTCVDLRTGQVIWSRNDVPLLSLGYIYFVYNPNQHGVYPAILFTDDFARAFDADTGNQLFNVTNVPTGMAVLGPHGEQLRMFMGNAGNATNPNWTLAEWNSSRLWTGAGFSGKFTGFVSTVTTNNMTGTTVPMTGSTLSGTLIVDGGISNPDNPGCRNSWNVTIPWRNTMSQSPTILAAFLDNMMLCMNGSFPAVGVQTPYTYFAVNLNASKGPIGSILWMKTYDPPAGNITVTFGGADPTVGVFVEGYKETMQFEGFSLMTGERLWGPTPSQSAWDYYGSPYYSYVASQLAYGNLYSSAFSGICYCYDLKTGKLKWTYGNGGAGNSTKAGFYVPYGDYPTFIYAVGNGVLYTIVTEHTATDPIYKGARARAINATDGTEIWALSNYGSGQSYAIADGFAVTMNGYDNQIYCLGRGPSATTVQAPLTAITAGDSVVIQGTITDIAAGTKQQEQAARFPNGVPAVSDASMTGWMEYVYMQKPKPTDATGVAVSLDALDPNNNVVHLGTVTSDSTGMFGYTWTPPDIPGDYKIIATFGGSNSYWPSFAETLMTITEAPPATPPPPAAAPLPPFDLYILIATVVIVIAVAIATVLILRKRP